MTNQPRYSDKELVIMAITNARPYLFKPGDKVQLLHRGRPTGRVAIVREVHEETYCLLADFIDKAPNEFPVYDYQDQFVLAT